MCIVFISTNLSYHKPTELLIYAILSIMPHKFKICKFRCIERNAHKKDSSVWKIKRTRTVLIGTVRVPFHFIFISD